MTTKNLFQVKFEKRQFVGIKVEPKENETEQDIVQGCVNTHREIMKLWFDFVKKNPKSYNAVIPTTIAKFKDEKVTRYCGYFYVDFKAASEFVKFSDKLVDFEIPEMCFLTMTHVGKILDKDDLWRLILKFIKEKNIKIDPSFTYESYPINETVTNNEKYWETEIYQPLLEELK